MAKAKEIQSKIIVFSPGWKTCVVIRAAIQRVLSFQNIPYNFILFSADMKTSVAIRTALRRVISFSSECQGGDNFLHVIFDQTFMEDERYSLNLARAISYLTTKPVYVCREGNLIEVSQEGNFPVFELPFQCDSLFQSKHIQRSHTQNMPIFQRRLRHYLDKGREKGLLLSIERYLDVTEVNAKIRNITKEVFDRMNMAAGKENDLFQTREA